jgi:polyhydroxyalkanoate synthesis regulator phasin
MTEKVNEIKSEMKEWFSSIENKMEDFLKTMKEWYSSKAESEALDIRIGKLEKGVLRLISLVAAWVVWAILKLILIW